MISYMISRSYMVAYYNIFSACFFTPHKTDDDARIVKKIVNARINGVKMPFLLENTGKVCMTFQKLKL